MSSSSLQHKRLSHAQLYLWIGIAVVSLGRGLFVAIKPENSPDLKLVYMWLRMWLWQGSDVYQSAATTGANYPPHAIVALSPLTLIPETWVAFVWALLNLALAPLVGYMAFRALKPGAPRRAALLPCAMFLAWASLRTGISNGQFTLLVLGAGLLAYLLAEKQPLWGGFFLALALMKPHIGGAFLLWALLTKRWKMTLVACVWIGVGVCLFSLRLGESPFETVSGYLAWLQHQFGRGVAAEGSTALRIVELRPFIWFLIPHEVWANRVHQLLLIILLACVGMAAWVKSKLDCRERNAVILQLCCLWLLMSVFHNPYDSILLLPVLMGLWPASVRQPLETKQWSNEVALWVLQFAMVVELPTIWWKLSQTVDLSGFNWAGILLTHFDRVLLLYLFIHILNRVRFSWLAQRESHGAGEMLAQPSTQNP
ncbi:MAG TPA: glycosyltransferase family 87 protein [Pyrinomonadaceae bacterium]